MLVLRRSPGQRIRVGDNIWITLVNANEAVDIGVDAPNGVKILREEVIGTKGAEVRLTHYKAELEIERTERAVEVAREGISKAQAGLELAKNVLGTAEQEHTSAVNIYNAAKWREEQASRK